MIGVAVSRAWNMGTDAIETVWIGSDFVGRGFSGPALTPCGVLFQPGQRIAGANGCCAWGRPVDPDISAIRVR